MSPVSVQRAPLCLEILPSQKPRRRVDCKTPDYEPSQIFERQRETPVEKDDRLGFVTVPVACLGRCESRESTIEYPASSALFSVVPVADMA
jgi:hypothetical protein